MIKVQFFKDHNGKPVKWFKKIMNEKIERFDADKWVNNLKASNNWYARNLEDCTYEVTDLPKYEETIRLLEEMSANEDTQDALDDWVEITYCDVCEDD